MDSRHPPDLRPVGDEPSAQPLAAWVVAHWLRPYIVEPTLWPVTIVVLAHIVVFLAPLMMLAWRDDVVAAWVTLGMTGALSLAGMVVEIRSARRPGAWCVITGLTRLASAAAVGGARVRDLLTPQQAASANSA